ncbi:MAG: Gfo/Idh/MocA family oxidoreductase [Anaerolineales bacterium]|nr:Gfo/Idh/MocA family oxidoreductase [Anaerolineales bacterium]
MTQLPLKGALIGAGAVTTFHMQAWDKIPQAEIVAIADPDLEKAGQRADEFGVDRAHIYPSLEGLLETEKGLDFVDIAASPEAHLALVEVAASNRLHTLCQKPFAPSLRDARRMIEIYERAGVLLAINENWHWRPWYRTLHKMVRDGAIGRPVYARIFAHGSFWLPGTTHPGHRFLSWPRVILFDWGVHHIDIYRFLFGEPIGVYARTQRLNANLIGEERALVVLEYTELTALIDLSWSSYAPHGNTKRDRFPMVEDLRLEGERGTIEFVPDAENGDCIRLTTAKGTLERPAWEGAPFDAYLGSYIGAQGHFIDCLRAGAVPETVAQDNIETLAVTLAAYESVRLGQVVRVSEFKARG